MSITKEEFHCLIKQWCQDTMFQSYIDTKHPAYIKALQGGEEVIPWALERLKDSIGHDHGEDMDLDNSPWFNISLLSDLTNGECLATMPHEYAGMLLEIRCHILKWGKTKGFIDFD